VRGDNRRDALQHGQRPAQPPPNVPTVEQQPSTTPAQSSPQPPSPPTNQDLAADLAAFRAQPAIHVLLDPRGAMPLRARITALEALRTGGMDNALMSYTLGTLYARQGPRARSTMLDRYVAAVAARPELARDPQLLDDVLDAAQTRGSVSERARDFLRGPLRAHAPRQIVARLAAQRTKPQRERDIALLSADFANAIDATVLQIIEVYRARSCAQIKTAVDALAATGDVRAVPTLESIPRAPRRCGWFNTCNPCLGDSVDRAIAAVRRRPAPEAWR
jgi:hypothetical protein